MNAIYWGFVSAPYVVALLLGLVLPLLVALAYRRFAVGAGLLGAVFCLNAALPELAREGFRLGITLYPADFVALMLMAVVGVRLVAHPELRPRSVALWVMVVVLVVNTLHGLAVNGAGGGNGARGDVYAFTAALYAMTFKFEPAQLRSLLRVLGAVALLMVLLAVYRWGVTAMDVRDLLPSSGSFQPAGHSKWRVIVSSEALVLAELAVLCWYFAGPGQPLKGWQLAAPLLLVMVGFLQHRSTWVALLMAILAATLAGRARRAAQTLLLVGVMGILGVGALVFGGGDVASDVQKSAAEAVQLKGTAAERLGSWRQLVKNWAGSGTRGVLIGQPTGTVLERYASDELGARRLSYQAHNYYVTVLTAHGAVGFAAFLVLLAQLLVRLYRVTRQPQHQTAAGVLLVLVVAQCGYYLTYGTDYLQWMALGVALAFARQFQPAPAASGKPAFRHPSTLPRPPLSPRV